MFRRCVANSLGGFVSGCAIEDNLAVFAFVRWRETTRLSQVHIQAIKTEDCDLKDYYAIDGKDHDVTYYRLDLDRFIGKLFTHPFPHVHISPHETPRYAINGWQSGNVVVDFLEHVYIQSFHDKWASWAEGIWGKHWDAMGKPAHENPFQTILKAAVDNQYTVLLQYAREIEILKSLLFSKKAEAFPFRVDMERCRLLAY